MATTTTTTIAATHNGVFHADDAIAGAILRGTNPQVRFLRSRNPADWEKADVIFDVGAKFDGGRWFDHHQRERAGARENGVLFSSAGLIWARFGEDYLRSLGELGVNIEELAARVDTTVIAGVDAIDNGQLTTSTRVKEVEVRVQDLSDVLSVLNPVALYEGDRMADFDSAFEEAVGIAGVILRKICLREASSLRARDDIRGYYKGGPLLVLERFYPWQETVVPEMAHVLLVVYPSPDGSWKVQVVPPELGSFGERFPLPAAWKGLRDADLAAETGVPDAVFCHPGGFIAGAKSKEGTLALARLALEAGGVS